MHRCNIFRSIVYVKQDNVKKLHLENIKKLEKVWKYCWKHCWKYSNSCCVTAVSQLTRANHYYRSASHAVDYCGGVVFRGAIVTKFWSRIDQSCGIGCNVSLFTCANHCEWSSSQCVDARLAVSFFVGRQCVRRRRGMTRLLTRLLAAARLSSFKRVVICTDHQWALREYYDYILANSALSAWLSSLYSCYSIYRLKSS